METPIGYGKNKFGELKEYFEDDFDEEELEELNSTGQVARQDYSEYYTIYSSKEKFKEAVTKEYDDYISILTRRIDDAKCAILTYEVKQIDLDRF